MRVPQVSDRIKEVPAQALRGVFAGIGQLLLITDRLRNKTPAHQQVPQARRPEASETSAETAAPTVPAAPPEKAPEPRDFDKTGNVRLLDGTEAAARDGAKAADETATAEAADAAGASVAAEGPAEAADTAAEEAGAPLPNYDELSIASLRARLRNLDAAQVKQLAEYERTHAARGDVIAMFERRIAKLEAGD